MSVQLYTPALQRPLVGVAVFVRRADGCLLMNLRQGSHGAGTWSIPGGLIEAYETTNMAAARELEEETGIVSVAAERYYDRLRAGEPRMCELVNTPAHLRFYEKDMGPQGYVTLFTLVDVPARTEAKLMEPAKCAEWRWIQIDDANVKWPGPIFECLKDLLDALNIIHPHQLANWLGGK